MRCTPGLSAVVKLAPAPSGPSRSDVHESRAPSAPSSRSLAVAPKATGRPATRTAPSAGAVIATSGPVAARRPRPPLIPTPSPPPKPAPSLHPAVRGRRPPGTAPGGPGPAAGRGGGTGPGGGPPGRWGAGGSAGGGVVSPPAPGETREGAPPRPAVAPAAPSRSRACCTARPLTPVTA